MRDRLRRKVSRRRKNAGIVLANHERIFHVLHVDIAEDDVEDFVAAVAIGLDANAVVGAVEVDALGEDVARASGEFAADGESVAMEKGAVGDGDVTAGIVTAGRVDGARFYGDIVVAGVGIEMIDVDIRR